MNLVRVLLIAEIAFRVVFYFVGYSNTTLTFVFTFLGYQPNVAQTSGTLNGLFIVISILPALGALLKLLILTKYDYTETEFKEYQRILVERGAEGYQTAPADLVSETAASGSATK